MTDRRGPVHGLILAAGEGRRFGGGKLLADLEGRPLLAHVLETAAAAVHGGVLAGVTAVVPGGPAVDPDYATRLGELARGSGAEVVLNDDPPAGLSRSLCLGLAALARGGAAAAIVFLGDQPRVRPSVVEALVAAWRSDGGPIVVPRYAEGGGAPGNPVLLDGAAWPLADALSGDVGMAAVVRAHPGLVTRVDVPGANPDVDTPADLASLGGR